MTMKKVSGDLAKNRDYLDRQLGVGESFDVLYRNVEIGKKNAAVLWRGCFFLEPGELV